MLAIGKKLAALALIAVPGSALADDGYYRAEVDNWTVAEEAYVCFMQTLYDNDDGSQSGIRFELDFAGESYLAVLESDWNFTGDPAGTAEIWIGEDYQRQADHVFDATGGGNGIWMDVGDPFVLSLQGQQHIVVRVTGGGMDSFARYNLGTTTEAIDTVFDCASFL